MTKKIFPVVLLIGTPLPGMAQDRWKPNVTPVISDRPQAAAMGTLVSPLIPNQTMEACSVRNTIEVTCSHKQGVKPFFCHAGYYHPYTPLPEYPDMCDIGRWGKDAGNGNSIKRPETLYQSDEELNPELRFYQETAFPGQYPVSGRCCGKRATMTSTYRIR